MAIEICAVGGYEEVGKNMTAVKVDDQVVLFDMGLKLEEYIDYTEDEDIVDMSPDTLMKIGAVPNIEFINDWKSKVVAIVSTHAHLDHIGAIPYLAKEFPKAKIFGTPYTITVLSTILKDDEIRLKNQLITINPNSKYKLNNDIKIELVHITHSTPQTAVIVLHTKYGKIAYSCDFKLDDTPTLGDKPNYKRFKELANENVLALITDSTYAPLDSETPSEAYAKKMLHDVMFSPELEDKAIIVTTFSSHLARIKSAIEFGKALHRRVILLGRSLAKYVEAGEKIGIVKFSKEAEIVKFGEKIKKRLKRLQKENLSNYLFIVTGHQGEPKAVLSKMVNNVFPFKLNERDCVIFSCKIIPAEVNIRNRRILEEKLEEKHVYVLKDVHASGHASGKDSKRFIQMIQPKNVIPAHGEPRMKEALKDIAVKIGYKDGKTVHLLKNGQRLKLQ